MSYDIKDSKKNELLLIKKISELFIKKWQKFKLLLSIY